MEKKKKERYFCFIWSLDRLVYNVEKITDQELFEKLKFNFDF